MKKHKKFWIIGIAAVLTLTAAAGCVSSQKTANTESPAAPVQTAQPEPTAEAKAEAGGKLGDFEVEILDARKATDYNGKPALVVGYDFANNSSKAAMFVSSMTYQAYQNGVQLSTALIMDGTYDAEPQMKNIQPGARLKVDAAYQLVDDSPVTVEVSPLFSLNGKKLTKIFNIK